LGPLERASLIHWTFVFFDGLLLWGPRDGIVKVSQGGGGRLLFIRHLTVYLDIILSSCVKPHIEVELRQTPRNRSRKRYTAVPQSSNTFPVFGTCPNPMTFDVLSC
jgi:hypothetical protein